VVALHIENYSDLFARIGGAFFSAFFFFFSLFFGLLSPITNISFSIVNLGLLYHSLPFYNVAYTITLGRTSFNRQLKHANIMFFIKYLTISRDTYIYCINMAFCYDSLQLLHIQSRLQVWWFPAKVPNQR
jgi:hypothetical protein